MKNLPCPYKVKTLQNSSPETKGQQPWALVCSIVDVGSTMYVD